MPTPMWFLTWWRTRRTAEELLDRSVRLRATDMTCCSGGDEGEVAVDGRGPFPQNKVGNPETSVAEWKQ